MKALIIILCVLSVAHLNTEPQKWIFLSVPQGADSGRAPEDLLVGDVWLSLSGNSGPHTAGRWTRCTGLRRR